jgi:hypothetical protein
MTIKISETYTINHHHFVGKFIINYEFNKNGPNNVVVIKDSNNELLTMHIKHISFINDYDKLLEIDDISYTDNFSLIILDVFKKLRLLKTPLNLFVTKDYNSNYWFLRNQQYTTIFMLT